MKEKNILRGHLAWFQDQLREQPRPSKFLPYNSTKVQAYAGNFKRRNFNLQYLQPIKGQQTNLNFKVFMQLVEKSVEGRNFVVLTPYAGTSVLQGN